MVWLYIKKENFNCSIKRFFFNRLKKLLLLGQQTYILLKYHILIPYNNTFDVIKSPIITKQKETYFIVIMVLKLLMMYQTNLLETNRRSKHIYKCEDVIITIYHVVRVYTSNKYQYIICLAAIRYNSNNIIYN